MASSLTQADVARLLAEPSPAARAEVADKLAREIDSTSLTEAELAIAQDIVRAMAKDVELMVRRALSQSLRSARHCRATWRCGSPRTWRPWRCRSWLSRRC